MNTSTGMLVSPEKFNSMPPADKVQYAPVRRDLSVKERANMQIKLYSPCGCGSGKKFKFCCKTKN